MEEHERNKGRRIAIRRRRRRKKGRESGKGRKE